MPTNRTPIAREQRGKLTADQRQALWLGPLSGAFESEDEARAAWERHRASMLRMFGEAGRRPVAWWRFDPEAAELAYPGYDAERSYLFEHGALGPEEAAGLTTYWKREFDKARAPGFAVCEGPGEWLTGRQAAQRHMRWADVPRSLVDLWEAEPVGSLVNS